MHPGTNPAKEVRSQSDPDREPRPRFSVSYWLLEQQLLAGTLSLCLQLRCAIPNFSLCIPLVVSEGPNSFLLKIVCYFSPLNSVTKSSTDK